MDVRAWSDYSTYLSGTVAIILNFFGLIALVVTLRLQQAQLLELSQSEDRRRISETLTQLLATLGSILEGSDIRRRSNGAVVATGRDAYRHYYKKLKAIYVAQNARCAEFQTDDREVVRRSFDQLYSRHGSDFGHYFRTLYHCVLLVDSAHLSDSEKRQFMSLITCRLSKFELLLLMYNCLGSIGERRFKELIERHSLLEHMPHASVIESSHLGFFTKSAYG